MNLVGLNSSLTLVEASNGKNREKILCTRGNFSLLNNVLIHHLAEKLGDTIAHNAPFSIGSYGKNN